MKKMSLQIRRGTISSKSSLHLLEEINGLEFRWQAMCFRGRGPPHTGGNHAKGM